jgi:hypothetical protein
MRITEGMPTGHHALVGLLYGAAHGASFISWPVPSSAPLSSCLNEADASIWPSRIFDSEPKHVIVALHEMLGDRVLLVPVAFFLDSKREANRSPDL